MNTVITLPTENPHPASTKPQPTQTQAPAARLTWPESIPADVNRSRHPMHLLQLLHRRNSSRYRCCCLQPTVDTASATYRSCCCHCCCCCLEAEAALTSCISQGLHATMVHEASAVKGNLADLLLLAQLCQLLADCLSSSLQRTVAHNSLSAITPPEPNRLYFLLRWKHQLAVVGTLSTLQAAMTFHCS